MDKILLFIPMYNCEKQIVRVLEQLKGKVLNYISEVIVVNNRSTDNGEQTVIKYLENKNIDLPIKLLRNKDNYGLGGSHKVAFNYALENKFDYVIVLHGDDQGNIKDFVRPLQVSLHKKYDCLLGSRFCRGSKRKGYSAFRIFGNYIFNTIYSIAALRPISDMGSGLNLYSVRAIKDRHYLKFADDLTFNCCSLFELVHYKKTFRFLPITWSEEDQVSNAKLISQAINILKIIGGYVFRRRTFINKDFRSSPAFIYEAKVIYENKIN